MTAQAQIVAMAAFKALPKASVAGAIKRAAQYIAETAADYHAAAAMYEALAALSDAELSRRGLSRATLAHDAQAVCRRGKCARDVSALLRPDGAQIQ
jgi:hypothetical protein